MRKDKHHKQPQASTGARRDSRPNDGPEARMRGKAGGVYSPHQWQAVPLLGLSAASGLLLYLSFPPADLWPLAYVALVPLLVAGCRAGSWKGAALCGLVAGLAAYLPGLVWLASVTITGWIGLSVYVSAYMVAAAIAVRFFRRRFRRTWPALFAAAWVGLELIRATFATGFPWLLLGYTQYRFASLIQIATLTGVYGLTFLLVLLNASLAETATILTEQRGPALPSIHLLFLYPSVAAALLVLCATAGRVMLSRMSVREGPVVGVVQQNIPRLVRELVPPADVAKAFEELDRFEQALKEGKSTPSAAPLLAYRTADTYEAERHHRIKGELQKVDRLSKTLAGRGVQLLAWPETTAGVPLNITLEKHSYPRSADTQEFTFETLRRLGQSMNCYMLVGAPAWFPPPEGHMGEVLYGTDVEDFGNSAFLFTPQGKLAGRYDKIHLVPFGEYVPLRDVLPFLQYFTPMTREIRPGEEVVIFELPLSGGEVTRFGALICYEDVIQPLVREFRRKGAQFLVNATDEGWYQIPGELRQHLAMAVFRAVETRTTVVRAANTGISCFISPRGKIYATVSGKVNNRVRITNVEGATSAPVFLSDQVPPYIYLGDAFACGCLLLSVVVLSGAYLLRRQKDG